MQIIVTPDHAAAFQAASTIIARQIRTVPASVLGLATGRTMEGLYTCLVEEHRQNGLDFSALTTFNLDEYVGLPPTSPQSYHHYMAEHLFSHVNIPPGQTHLPNGTAQNLDAECTTYEALIEKAGGIDLQLLGIGETGHIGFNEPPSPFTSRTRPVTLDPITRQQNAGMFNNNPDQVPTQALTMGVGTILDTRHLLLIATGAAKADIVAQALLGPITPEISASAIRLHGNCTVILDKTAASIWEKQ